MTDAFSQAAHSALAEFLEHRERIKTTPFLFPLTASSLGKKKVSKVKARRLNLMDRANIGHLPEHMADFVWEQLRKIDKEREDRERAGEDPRNIEEALANNAQYLRSANIYCHAAFMELDGEPIKVVLTEAEEDVSRGRLWVERIEAEDRFAFLMACNDADSKYARRFELFREESRGDVPAGDSREVLGVSPVGAAGPAGSGAGPD